MPKLVSNAQYNYLISTTAKYEASSRVDYNANSPIMQGISQQIASLGANQAFAIKGPDGVVFEAAKISHPPMVRPMLDQNTVDAITQTVTQAVLQNVQAMLPRLERPAGALAAAFAPQRLPALIEDDKVYVIQQDGSLKRWGG